MRLLEGNVMWRRTINFILSLASKTPRDLETELFHLNPKILFFFFFFFKSLVKFRPLSSSATRLATRAISYIDAV